MYSKSYSNVDKLIVIAIVATTFLPSTMVFHMLEWFWWEQFFS